MRRIPSAILAVFMVSWPTAAVVAQETHFVRGMYLYENHCQKCHESTVHVREKRKAESLPEIRAFIERWSSVEELGWSRNEVEDVLQYLNGKYYKY